MRPTWHDAGLVLRVVEASVSHAEDVPFALATSKERRIDAADVTSLDDSLHNVEVLAAGASFQETVPIQSQGRETLQQRWQHLTEAERLIRGPKNTLKNELQSLVFAAETSHEESSDKSKIQFPVKVHRRIGMILDERMQTMFGTAVFHGRLAHVIQEKIERSVSADVFHSVRPSTFVTDPSTLR
mmetsp:Transcript_23459/g.61676  ORF Transcript_23459/g.61676 Transcript_23459/m.61676 type:complete len:185 (+) Transcript_23459:802-1356(+)